MLKRSLIAVVVSTLVWMVAVSASPKDTAAQSGSMLAVLADPTDPYYALALEIAAVEDASLYHSLSEVLESQSAFLLWVTAPEALSDKIMVQFGTALRASRKSLSTGIITGSNIELARALWNRRTQVGNRKLFAANAANPSTHIFSGELLAFSPEKTATSTLTRASFQEALAAADYLTFTGHGSSWYLGLDEEHRITAMDVPVLDSPVISTGSCQTIRPWVEGSISMAFVDQGAAAYSGFVYSPNEGYLMGEFNGLPMRYTWPEFPIGLVIQVQNRGILQGFAQFPYHYLLGDPRIALQTQPPYQLINDQENGPWRTLSYTNIPSGVIPIRVSKGAKYAYVDAVGITAAAEKDPFYNSRLQWVDIGTEKYILLEHPGGELTLRLRLQPPWYWYASDLLLDSLDHTLIYIQENEGDKIVAVIAFFPLIWTGWMGLNKKLAAGRVRSAIFFGIGAALLQLGYTALRLEWITITSKPTSFNLLSIVNAFLLAFYAALIFFHGRRTAAKAIALIVISVPCWIPAIFSLLLIWFYNQFGFVPQLGAPLYNYALGLLPLGSWVFMVGATGVMLEGLRRSTEDGGRHYSRENRYNEQENVL